MFIAPEIIEQANSVGAAKYVAPLRGSEKLETIRFHK